MVDSKDKRVSGAPKAKMKEHREEVIEVFPTTAQLAAVLAIAVVALVGLIYLDFTQTKSKMVKEEAAKAAKANYFNIVWRVEMTRYEGSIALPRIQTAALKGTMPSDAVKLKLARSSELALGSKLAAVYPVLKDDERKFLRSSLSDWKLARLISTMPPLEAQKLIADLYADMTELQAVEEAQTQSAAAAADRDAATTSPAADAATGAAGSATGSAGGESAGAAGAGGGAATDGEMLGMVSPSGTTSGP